MTKTELEIMDRIEYALTLLFDHGGTDGDHHKAWVIDRCVRILTGGTLEESEEYRKWVEIYEEDGNYRWEKGIAP